MPSAVEAVASAAEEQAANAQLLAESDSAAELQRAETVRVARDAAALSRQRLGGRRVQLQAVVFGYYRKYGLRPGQRTAEGLAAAPQAVRDAFEELQRVDATLGECEVA